MGAQKNLLIENTHNICLGIRNSFKLHTPGSVYVQANLNHNLFASAMTTKICIMPLIIHV